MSAGRSEIVLFTDFGVGSPYVGQMTAVLRRNAPEAAVIELFSDLAPFNAKAAAYLLPAFASEFPAGSVFLCIVDPGVGGDRAAGVLEADGRWYVGPDNGLFELVARRAGEAFRWQVVTWRPERLSASFHGRDLFAPIAARIALGDRGPDASWGGERPTGGMLRRPDWPDDLEEVVYVDRYGNAMTGVRATMLGPGRGVALADGRRLVSARTFSDIPPGRGFWYENSNGLVEIAVNHGRADVDFGLAVGTAVRFTSS